jgi:cytochrome c553
MSFRAVFIAIAIAFALILSAFLFQHALPCIETDQPNASLMKAAGKCAECHRRQQYSPSLHPRIHRNPRDGPEHPQITGRRPTIALGFT